MIPLVYSPRFLVGIVGTRKRDTDIAFKKVKKSFFNLPREVRTNCWIVSGGCPKGGDRFAEMLARRKGIPIVIFYPDWREFNKSAGFVRNGSIADLSDYLIACVSKDRKGGTEDTIKKFKKKLKYDLGADRGKQIKKKIKEFLKIVK